MRPTAMLVLAAVLVGCATSGRRPAPAPESPAAAALREAEADVHAGQPRAAQSAYARALEADPNGPLAEAALWGLARLHVDPESPLCDYHAALTAFDRLLAAHPQGAHAADARAWHTALRQLVRSEREASRLRADIDHLRELEEQTEGR